ncbi:MAG: type I-C CRISPR-associated protein Cas8c/Csd1 [Candidatus Accumulibacter sp.]|jgi:CRISPR-associated protein Csd1|nr:type I-C CRISPR-associated protein Cas8c/Csd1 [Accumulibacter sp.]
MILQALKEYYDRKAADPESNIAPFGWEWKEIPFIIVLNNNGVPVDIKPTVEGTGKNKKTQWFLVPQSVIRTGEKTETREYKSNLLWDTIDYTIGFPSGDNKNIAICNKQHQAFKEKIAALDTIDDPGFIALQKFLELSDKENKLKKYDKWEELKKKGLAHVFKLAGIEGILTDTQKVRQAINEFIKKVSESSSNKICCLVSGEPDEIELTHAKIKGVLGCKSTGGSIVSVNFSAGESFGRRQGSVSPIGKHAAFFFATALNTLLSRDSKQKLQVGDATTVFWAEKRDKFEEDFGDFWAEPPGDNPDRLTNAVKSLYKSVDTGAFVTDSDNTRFYVLGLSPNAARISVRFWHVGTISEFASRFREYFDDLRIVHGSKDKDHLPLWRYLISLAALGKTENIPHGLAGNIMRAILEGLPLPLSLLQVAILRNRAEQDVTYPRAALIKAALNRSIKNSKSTTERKLKMSLDTENDNVGYRLGRLFAVLGNVQHAALGGQTNTTIRDRYYSAASTAPASVFPTLLRNTKNHLGKLRKEKSGLAVKLEKEIQEILWGRDNEIKSGVPDFPAHLFLKDQGRFAIGYYHQRQDFFTKHNTVKE